MRFALALFCILVVLTGAIAFLFINATQHHLKIGNITYTDYGLLSLKDENPNIRYEPNWPNIIAGALLCETIVMPIYIFGYHLMEPVGPAPLIPGQIEE
jgi:hypothetical protein